jgi:hypothetical protein
MARVSDREREVSGFYLFSRELGDQVFKDVFDSDNDRSPVNEWRLEDFVSLK